MNVCFNERQLPFKEMDQSQAVYHFLGTRTLTSSCNEVITFNRGEACVATACLCPCSQENHFSLRTTKSLLIPIIFLPGKLFVDDIHGCLIRSEVVLTSTINLHVSVL